MALKRRRPEKHRVLGEAIRREFMELTSLTKISEAMSSSFNLRNLLSLIMDTVTKDIPCDQAFLLVVNPVSGEYELEYTSGLEEEELTTIREGRNQIINWVLKKSFPLLMIDELRDEVFTDPSMQSLIALPLKVTDRVIGLIELARIKPSSSFTVNDQALLSVYAAQTALAIENTRLTNAARGKIRELNKLNEIGKLLNSTLDLEQILDTIINTFKEMINVQAASILLVDNEQARLTLVFSEIPSDELVENMKHRLFSSYYSLTGTPVPEDDFRLLVEVGSQYHDLQVEEDLNSHLIVP
ncbi:MAG: GAF domain-containing protein, partial [bacterium]|nr:GAF domain-containing protein [bacterium]